MSTTTTATLPAAMLPVDAFRCRITNPTVRPRVIYDGLKNEKPIRIMPGQTIEAVLSDMQIGFLQDEELANPNEPDLKVVELGPAPPAPPPPVARSRRARPATESAPK